MVNIFSTILLSLLLQGSSTIFETNLWPGEGRPAFEATSRQLLLHEAPSTSSRVIQSVNVTPGQRVDFNDTRYRTTQVGRFRALVNTQVKGRRIGNGHRLSREDYYSDGFASAIVEVNAATTFDYLQYRAEGACFVRIDGTVIDAAPCPTIDKSSFRLERKPATEWWIHATIGSAHGWLLVGKSTVKQVGVVVDL